jgi:hypothetical protein
LVSRDINPEEAFLKSIKPPPDFLDPEGPVTIEMDAMMNSYNVHRGF